MNYKAKNNFIVTISIATLLVSVFGLSIITTGVTHQWLALIFFLCGYSMFWLGIIGSKIGMIESLYTRIFSKMGEKKYIASIIISISIGIWIVSQNKIIMFLLITLMHLIISGILITTYVLITEYIEEIPSKTTSKK